jgi:hypothetical protein
MRWPWLAITWAAACLPKPAPAPAPPPPPPPLPKCIKPPDEARAITRATGDPGRVQYCVGKAADQCFALDLASGALDHLTSAPPAAPESAAHVEATSPELKICTRQDCKALTALIWPGAAPIHAATNGAFAVLLLGDAERGDGYAEVWDVTKAKKTATFRYARGDFKCGDVAMLGDTIYIGASTCSSPSARGALFTLAGRRIANVGPKDFGTFGSAMTQVDATTWAFLEENGDTIAVQDVAKGKLLKTIDVTALWQTGSDAVASSDAGSAAPGSAAAGSDARADAAAGAIGNPGESAIVKLSADKLAVIGGTPANGSVAVIDVGSGEVKIVRAPLCPGTN